MKRINKNDNEDVKATVLAGLDPGKIGFGTVFRATMGFYVAQTVATLGGLLIIASVIAFVIVLVKNFA